MMETGQDAAWLRLPLQGEWVALRSPAEQPDGVEADHPSGRYAFDFIRLNEAGDRFHRGTAWREWLGLLQSSECLAWGEPVLAPLDADVVEVSDDRPDAPRVHSPLRRYLLQHLARPRGDWRDQMGNYVLLRASVGYVLCAHLQQGSITVRAGDCVSEGQPLARVGQSGNCDQPHLHLQLMDAADVRVAHGLPCGFKHYERLLAGDWMPMRRGQPEWMQRVRDLSPL